MKLPIKFRGKTIDGETICSNGIKTDEKPNVCWLRDEFYNWLEVEPDSIVPLIGFDKDGREVYEGDALLTENGVTIYAYNLRHAKIAPTPDPDFEKMAKDGGWKLKEE